MVLCWLSSSHQTMTSASHIPHPTSHTPHPTSHIPHLHAEERLKVNQPVQYCVRACQPLAVASGSLKSLLSLFVVFCRCRVVVVVVLSLLLCCCWWWWWRRWWCADVVVVVIVVVLLRCRCRCCRCSSCCCCIVFIKMQCGAGRDQRPPPLTLHAATKVRKDTT